MIKGILKVAAAAAVAAGVGYAAKTKRVTPSAAAARAINSLKVTAGGEDAYGNGIALTPPMGWSSWNLFRNKINEKLIMETAEAMVKSGLADAGYQYINLDDCWQSSLRDEQGRMIGDLTNFPSGIKALVAKINALGLKTGIYSSNGTLTCEDMPASLGNEAIDADTFAEWGIEYFKYDFCHNSPIPTSGPNIEKISIGRRGEEDFLTVGAEDARLEGHARLTSEPGREGLFIAGLGGNVGAAYFDVVVDDDGEYVLTLGLRKFGLFRKYAKIIINGTDEYEAYFSSTKGFTPDGRQQLNVRLKAGANEIKIFNPVSSRMDGAALQYINMGKELKRATAEYAEKNGVPEKPICYSICEWGMNRPWNWGRHAGNLWRTTPDIKPFWASILGIYEVNVLLAKHAGPGGWNDPDMLEVGNGDLTDTENKSHFTLWCMMSSPLILGNDLRSFVTAEGKPDLDNPVLKIISNKELISIDQDPLGVQCRRFKTNGKVDVLVKPLENRELAVCFFNKFGEESEESISLREIMTKEYCGLPDAYEFSCHELWDDTTFITNDRINVSIPSHGVVVYKIKAVEQE